MKYRVYFSTEGLLLTKDIEEHEKLMEKAYPEFVPFEFEAKNIKEARKIIDERLGKDLAFELKGELGIYNYKTNKTVIY